MLSIKVIGLIFFVAMSLVKENEAESKKTKSENKNQSSPLDCGKKVNDQGVKCRRKLREAYEFDIEHLKTLDTVAVCCGFVKYFTCITDKFSKDCRSESLDRVTKLNRTLVTRYKYKCIGFNPDSVLCSDALSYLDIQLDHEALDPSDDQLPPHLRPIKTKLRAGINLPPKIANINLPQGKSDWNFVAMGAGAMAFIGIVAVILTKSKSK